MRSLLQVRETKYEGESTKPTLLVFAISREHLVRFAKET